MDMKAPGRLVKSLREEAGLTREELAEGLSLNPVILQEWEEGKFLPDLDELKALAFALGVTWEEIVAGKKMPRPQKTGNAKEDFLAQWQAQLTLRPGERMEYFSRKWYRDHLPILILLASVSGALVLVGWFAKLSWLLVVGFLALAAVMGWMSSSHTDYVRSRTRPAEDFPEEPESGEDDE